MTSLDSILKSWDIILSTKIHLVKATVFPVVIHGCESWTIMKAEHWRIGAFELWCWRTLLRVPWTARRSNKSILKEISPGCSLEGLMLKLKLQYFGHLMWRADSFEKTLMLGKIVDRRRRGPQRMRWLHGITDSMDRSLGELQSWWWTGRPGVLRFMGSQRVGHDWATELNWTELNSLLCGPTLTSIHDYWKNHSFDYMDVCWQSDVSDFNVLSRFVIAFASFKCVCIYLCVNVHVYMCLYIHTCIYDFIHSYKHIHSK